MLTFQHYNFITLEVRKFKRSENVTMGCTGINVATRIHISIKFLLLRVHLFDHFIPLHEQK